METLCHILESCRPWAREDSVLEQLRRMSDSERKRFRIEGMIYCHFGDDLKYKVVELVVGRLTVRLYSCGERILNRQFGCVGELISFINRPMRQLIVEDEPGYGDWHESPAHKVNGER